MIYLTDKTATGTTVGKMLTNVEHMSKGQQAIKIIYELYCTVCEWEVSAIRDMNAHKWNWSEATQSWNITKETT